MKNYALGLTVSEFLEKSDDVIFCDLKKGFSEITGENMNNEQASAWKGAIPKLKKALKDLDKNILMVFEYMLPMSSERIDLVLIGNSNDSKPTAIILELKGWRDDKEIAKYESPEFQVLNYVGKLKFSHSASDLFNFIPCVWLYNMHPGSLSFEKLKNVFWSEEYERLGTFLKSNILQPAKDQDIDAFLNGHYTQTPKLLEAISRNFESLRKGFFDALCETGFAPSEEQLQIIEEVIQSVKNGEKKVCYLIEGQPGSGKSYIAILLLLTALKDSKSVSKKQNIAVLGYRNNRLINTLRKIFNEHESGLDTVLKFFSTGRNQGLAENNPRIGHFKLVIFDEAQRMSKENIRVGLQRGDIVVVFYDERQILNLEEEGTRENFISVAGELGIKVVEKTLRGIYRVQGGPKYHNFVETLLDKPEDASIPELKNYEFKIFDDIEEMLDQLKSLRLKNKVALVASFTESPGDRDNPKEKNIKNLRIGYPLWSGFEHYKDKNVEIYWLMDEKKQYPNFWFKGESNELTHCASIYGCQGFEADYVGVIWGRDFVFRNGKWEIGDNCEDNIGRPTSLKDLVINRDNRALDLLINRYRIFLTRGIKGTYVYCEDEETKRFLLEKQKSLENSRKK